MSRVVVAHACVAAVALVLVSGSVAAQAPTPPRRPTEPSTPPPSSETQEVTSSGTLPWLQLPGVLTPPRVGPEMLYAPPPQGRLMVTPSLSVLEEYNDNVFLTTRATRADFITQFTPGLALAIRQPDFRLTAAYSFTAEIYARESALSNPLARQALLTNVAYRMNPHVTLNVTDDLLYSKTSIAASISGVSRGREETWSNLFASGLDVKATPRMTWHLLAADTLERFSARGSHDAAIYRFGTGVDFAATPRFTITGSYDFAYLDIRRAPTALTHTPRLGGIYRVTPTVTATLSAGPSFLISEHETTVTPAVTARLTKIAPWGAMSAFYDRATFTAGGFGGAADTQTVGGDIAALRLRRGLVVDFSPRYTQVKTEVGPSTDINALTLTLNASYQITAPVAVIAAYTFFHERTGGTAVALDASQDLIFLGLRVGYPLSVY